MNTSSFKYVLFFIVLSISVSALTVVDVNPSTPAYTGDCPAGFVVQNTTSSGVECISLSNATASTNSSDFWDTLDTPTDIPGSVYWYNMTFNATDILNNITDIYTNLSSIQDQIDGIGFSDTDTNVTTACSGANVLLGNGTCLPYSGTATVEGKNLSYVNYAGSDASGSDGDSDRVLSQMGSFVIVDNQFLHPDVDYNFSSNEIQFLNPLYDSQVITLWNISVNGTTGGGGTPGGSDGQIQYNNGGAFGGFGSWDGTELDVPGNINMSLHNVTNITATTYSNSSYGIWSNSTDVVFGYIEGLA